MNGRGISDKFRRDDRDRVLGLVEKGGYLGLDDSDFYKALKLACKYAGPPTGLTEALEEKCALKTIGSRELVPVFFFTTTSSNQWLALKDKLLSCIVGQLSLAVAILGEASQQNACDDVSYRELQSGSDLITYEVEATVAMDGRTYVSPKVTGPNLKGARQLAAAHLLYLMVGSQASPVGLPLHLEPISPSTLNVFCEKLWSWCQEHGINTRPESTLSHQVLSGDWKAQVLVTYQGKQYQSLTQAAKKKKEAVNLAAHDLLVCFQSVFD